MKASFYLLLILLLGVALCSQISESPAPATSDNLKSTAAALNDKATRFLEAEQYDSAYTYAQKGGEISEKTKDWNEWGKAQLNLLTSSYYLDRYAEAAATFPVVEQKAQAAISPDSAFWGEYFNLTGAIFNKLGNYEEALRYGLKEIAFYEKNGDSLSQALASNNVGTYYRSRGDYDRALEYTQSALQIYRSYSKTDPADLSWTYSNLSAIWYRKKDYPQSIATSQEALAILEKHFPGKMPHERIIIYSDLANAHVEIQEHDKALEYIQKALQVHKQNDVEEELEITWHNLGYIYRMMGRYPEAIVYLKKAIERYGAAHPNLGKAYRHLGFIALRQGDLHGALGWQQQALLTLTDSFPYQDILANPAPQRVNAYQDFLFTLRDKGETLQKLAEKESNPKFLEASLATYDLAMGLLDSMRAEYQEGSRQFWNQEARPIMENAIGVALRLYQNSGGQQFLEQAFRYAEKSKALLLAEALRDAAARQQAGIPDSILQEEKSLKIDIAFYKRQIFREQQKAAPDTAKMLGWQKNILERRRANEALLARLENSYPEYYQIKYGAPALSIPALQQLLPPNTGLLQYFRGDQGLYVFYFDKTAARGLQLNADSSLTQTLERLLGNLRDRNQAVEQGRNAAAVGQFATDAAALYRMLLAPAFEKMPEKLVVIPDGNLSYLPFELLLTESDAATSYADLPFLLRKTVLRYEYSASLALQRQPHRSPDYFFAGYAPAYESDLTMASRDGNSTCRDAETTAFASLLNNQNEVSQIAQMLRGQSFLGAAATEQTFKQRIHEPRILHLAMHGFLNDCDPLYSGLAFSRPAQNAGGDSIVGEDANNRKEENDGFLHAYEIYNLKMNAEMAVLSACNTGRGHLAKGEGVISLARAFKYAGCPNVLMSLWQADDQATAQIMQDFYKNLKQGMGKDEAIRQAKLTYLGANSRNHPFFWGAFVLIGDDAPVKQPTQWIWYGAALLLLAGAGFWYWHAKRKT